LYSLRASVEVVLSFFLMMKLRSVLIKDFTTSEVRRFKGSFDILEGPRCPPVSVQKHDPVAASPPT